MNEVLTYLVEPKGELWTVRESGGQNPAIFEGPFHAAWEHAIELGRNAGRARVRALNRDGQAIAQEET